MAKANRYFTKRGETDITVNFNDEDIKVKILIPTNKEHDELMERFTLITPEGTGDISMADFVEEEMVKFIVELPFEVPTDLTMNNFADWKDINVDERKIAVSLMDPTLRDLITNNINGVTKVSQEDSGN